MPAAMPPCSRTYLSFTSMTIRFFGLVFRGSTPMTATSKGVTSVPDKTVLAYPVMPGFIAESGITGSDGTNPPAFPEASAPSETARTAASVRIIAVIFFILRDFISTAQN